MEHAIPTFLQSGAMGVMALGFLTLLILFVRSDRRSQAYANKLSVAGFDRSQLIQVVARNAEASAALAAQIAEANKTQDRMLELMNRIHERMTTER